MRTTWPQPPSSVNYKRPLTRCLPSNSPPPPPTQNSSLCIFFCAKSPSSAFQIKCFCSKELFSWWHRRTKESERKRERDKTIKIQMILINSKPMLLTMTMTERNQKKSNLNVITIGLINRYMILEIYLIRVSIIARRMAQQRFQFPIVAVLNDDDKMVNNLSQSRFTESLSLNLISDCFTLHSLS